ncbi:MAG: peptidase T [bacterium]|nr:peptidase T [bacterium]
MHVLERFLSYVKIDTESVPDREQIPSSKKQFDLAKKLEAELREMGASDVRLDAHCYVYAKIPANTDKKVPAVGFIAHMDTSPAISGANVKPRIIRQYDGKDITLNETLGVYLRVSEFPALLNYKGQDLVVTDGTTLLGADDKAGVAEIMSMAEYLLTHPEILHGDILIGFTPDEEVGNGATCFDVKNFGADVAYTVDGGEIGELEYENFNAASLKVHIQGRGIHPGSAKGKMKNALLIAMEFQAMLPVFDNPMYTEMYEGFYHLDGMSGNVETANMDYIIRDHDREKFEQKKAFVKHVETFLNAKYGEGTVTAVVKDSYLNMKELIAPHMYLIDYAKEEMEHLGITPIISPIRGGTDGARLSYEGLPCPNLCTGGHNYHGKYEYVCVQSMEKITELLVKLAERFAKSE